MRFPASARLLIGLLCWIACTPGSVLGEEKTMTPLAGGVPMIEGIKMLEPGAVAPDFSIMDADGKPFRLADGKGKKTFLLVFCSIFCEPCSFELPAIQKMQVKFREAGLEVATIALDGEPLKNSIAGFIKQEGYTFRVLIDELDSREMFKAADPYGVAGTPTLFLLDREGKVAFARAGRLTEEELEKAIQAVLKK
jgi:peroxiredoxin